MEVWRMRVVLRKQAESAFTPAAVCKAWEFGARGRFYNEMFKPNKKWPSRPSEKVIDL